MALLSGRVFGLLVCLRACVWLLSIMCIAVYLCVHVCWCYMCLCAFVCVCVCWYTLVCMYVGIYVYLCTFVCVWCLFLCMCVCLYVHWYIFAFMCVLVSCVDICMHVWMYVYVIWAPLLHFSVHPQAGIGRLRRNLDYNLLAEDRRYRWVWEISWKQLYVKRRVFPVTGRRELQALGEPVKGVKLRRGT